MNGSYEDKFKQLKVLMTYQMTHPGKILNFMGNEIATFEEWSESIGIRWDYLNYPIHDSYNRFVKDLNKIYKDEKAFSSMIMMRLDLSGKWWMIILILFLLMKE